MTADLLFDISAGVNQGAGIGRYARELTRELIPMFDPGNTALWYAASEQPHDPDLPTHRPWSDLEIRKSPISRRNVDRLLFRRQLPVARLLRMGNSSNVYSPDFTAPGNRSTRTHITVHDLAWLHPEADTPPGLASFLAPVVERAVRSAETVFTVSHVVRDEIAQRYARSTDSILVAPNAAAEHFYQAEPFDDAALVTFGLRRPFLLSVGTIEPRKNVSILFEALSLLSPTLQLVVVGRAGWNAASIIRHVDHLGLTGRVIQLGFVPDRTLAALMASAMAVVYPSRYEGFGLPVIEALATGTPVIASDLPVFREVGGEVVCYVDPADANRLAEAISQRQSSSDSQAERKRRIEQARKFSWKQSAEIVAHRLQEFA